MLSRFGKAQERFQLPGRRVLPLKFFFYFLFSAVRVVGSSHLEGKGLGAADQ
jgi:hypothetical protein